MTDVATELPARPPGRPLGWTTEQVEALIGLNKQKLSGRAMGLLLGMTKGAVIGKLHRMGLRVESKYTKNYTRGADARIRRSRPRGGVPNVKADPSLAMVRYHIKKWKPTPQPVAIAAPTIPWGANFYMRKLIWETTAQTCKWPLFTGDEPLSQRWFCGDVPVDGAPYCRHHASRAYYPVRSDPNRPPFLRFGGR